MKCQLTRIQMYKACKGKREEFKELSLDFFKTPIFTTEYADD